MSEPGRFSSRFALLVSVLGIAVGTGNVWRFPRIVAQHGGEAGAGAFLLAWVICLATWSLPLLVAEYAVGKATRAGVPVALARLAGPRWGAAGAFVAWVATAIMFYYSVVCGWCFYYLGVSVALPLPEDHAAAVALWDGLQAGWMPVVLHAVAMALAAGVVWRGIASIERLAMVLVPLLVLILLACAVRAMSLPGASAGLEYLFTPDWSVLALPRTWLEALTQNAWDTGAGWGLVLCYATYMRKGDHVVRNGLATGIGNNVMSLVAATLIFSTVFALLGPEMGRAGVLTVMRDSGPASTGLTFIWLPQLFARMPGGDAFAPAFFLALSFAAFTSLVAMVELATRVLADAGVARGRAVTAVAAAGFLLGVPSALDLRVLGNQDFVWGVGLMISGLLIALAVARHGVARLRREILDEAPGDLRWGPSFELLMRFAVPAQATVLLIWWLALAGTQFAAEDWWDPRSPFSPATCFLQWGVAAAVCAWLAPRLTRSSRP